MTFVLLHSPLVGVSTWEGVAGVLLGLGRTAVRPDLSGVLDAQPPYWRRIAETVVRAVEEVNPGSPLVLVGHSGAGPLLPACAMELERRVGAYVFVDAGLPHGGQSVVQRGPRWFVDQLRSLDRGGWLPPWHRWWGDGVLEQSLADERLRARFVAELRPIPMAFFEEPHPVVEGWPEVPCAYLRLSSVFDDAAREARSRGWPLRMLRSHHLGMLTDPERVAREILALAVVGSKGEGQAAKGESAK